MEIRNVCIVGGGKMGRQIGLNAAIHGYKVTVYDVSQEACDDIIAWEKDYLAGRVKKGRMTQEEVDAVAANYTAGCNLEEMAKDADLVIEAIFEVEEAKRDIFTKLNKIVRNDTILASNSSYMVSSLFKNDVDNPSRLANLHYFNPALVMELVEVVKGEHTSEETAQALMDFARSCKKTPILLQKEIEGFVVNRILSALKREARFLVQNGYVTPQEADLACEKGLNHPMGPFKLDDFTGLDLVYTIMTDRYKREGVKPDCYDLFEGLVKEGKLGRKNGHGIYDYE